MSAAAFCGLGQGPDLDLLQVKSARVGLADLRGLLGEDLTAALTAALLDWQRRLPGFADQGLLAGVESRTYAPVRILRGQDRQSLNCQGLYPAGEGAGYAGGIVSSAIDGMRSALALLEQNK